MSDREKVCRCLGCQKVRLVQRLEREKKDEIERQATSDMMKLLIAVGPEACKRAIATANVAVDEMIAVSAGFEMALATAMREAGLKTVTVDHEDIAVHRNTRSPFDVSTVGKKFTVELRD